MYDATALLTDPIALVDVEDLAEADLEAEIIGVTSWRSDPYRPAPDPLPRQEAPAPMAQPSAGFTYVGPSYAREVPAAPPFPDRRARRF